MKIRTKDIIIFLLSILPAVDSLNGLMVKSGQMSVGMPYKIIMMAVIFVLIYKNKFSQKYIMWILIVVMYVLWSTTANVLFFSGKIVEIDYIVKLLFNVVLICFLLQCFKSNVLSGTDFFTILNHNANLLIFCILIPYLLGLGYTVYSGGVGYKAFYYSQNELSSILIILVYFLIYKLTLSFRLKTIIQLGAMFVCVALLNTKASLIACVLGLVMWFLIFIINKPLKYKIATMIIFLAGLIGAGETLLKHIQLSLDRQRYLYGIYGNSIFSAILSGRDFLLKNAWNHLVEGDHVIFRFIFGNGFCSGHLTEMDICDIFFYLGFTGAAVSVLFLIYVFIKSIPNFKKDESIIRLFSYCLIVGLICLSGHVLFMATAGSYFGIYCCFNMTYSRDGSRTSKTRT